jgi:glycosyltransferase involved in cell wall biosynthesis
MGVELSKFQAGAKPKPRAAICAELNIPSQATLVLSVAYLTPEKGVLVLFEAAAIVCSKRTDIHFLLAGLGPAAEELKRRVDEKDLAANFHLLGWCSDADKLMSATDIFALPSHYFEGLSVSILEALAYGMPVITTEHRGCRDASGDSSAGVLVPVRSPSALAEKIVLLPDDRALRSRMGVAARRRAEQKFDARHCNAKIRAAIAAACR